MINDLLLLSGNDIPFLEAQVNIHQPTIKEIAYIGEENFFIGCELLNFSKDILNKEDKINLEDKSNFEILMSIMGDKNIAAQKSKTCAIMVLMLLFPEYKIIIKKNKISLIKENEDEHSINNNNFESFRQILISIFCLKMGDEKNPAYNPGNEMAKRIAEKLQKGRAKVAAMNGESNKISILNRYISILAVGQSKDINSLMQYTVYQLYDEFQRFELKQNYDIYFNAKLAGAKDLDEVDNWMKDIHS